MRDPRRGARGMHEKLRRDDDAWWPGLKEWARNERRPLGLLGAVAATGMAGLWIAVVPDKAAETSGVQELAIRWGHPACWALLALVGFLVSLDAPKRLRDIAAVAAAVLYAAFLTAMLL